jgi:quinol monooxygenase YgiN
MIIIAGELRVDPDDRGRYLDAVASVAPQARAAAGCLDFVQSADPVEADRINVYERWESDEALQAFRSQDGPDTAETPPLRSADVHKYRIASVESP